MKNINVVFIVLEVGAATVTKENREVRTFKVADPTACINVSVWDEPGKLLVPGDIVRLTKGYATIWRHSLTLYSGKNGDIHRIGDFCLNFNEQLNMSEPQPMGLAVGNLPMGMGNGSTSGNGSPLPGRAPISAIQAQPGMLSGTGGGSGSQQAKPLGTAGGSRLMSGDQMTKASTPVSQPAAIGKNSLRGGRSNQTRSNVKNDRR